MRSLAATPSPRMFPVWTRPRSAVVSLGTEQVVFVAADAGFTARSVQVGVRSDSLVQVLGGIKPAERVAANGQFLMDSESFIQTTP